LNLDVRLLPDRGSGTGDKLWRRVPLLPAVTKITDVNSLTLLAIELLSPSRTFAAGNLMLGIAKRILFF
jgi:hypothetical protein